MYATTLLNHVKRLIMLKLLMQAKIALMFKILKIQMHWRYLKRRKKMSEDVHVATRDYFKCFISTLSLNSEKMLDMGKIFFFTEIIV